MKVGGFLFYGTLSDGNMNLGWQRMTECGYNGCQSKFKAQYLKKIIKKNIK